MSAVRGNERGISIQSRPFDVSCVSLSVQRDGRNSVRQDAYSTENLVSGSLVLDQPEARRERSGPAAGIGAGQLSNQLGDAAPTSARYGASGSGTFERQGRSRRKLCRDARLEQARLRIETTKPYFQELSRNRGRDAGTEGAGSDSVTARPGCRGTIPGSFRVRGGRSGCDDKHRRIECLPCVG